jgi:hypothetical protein
MIPSDDGDSDKDNETKAPTTTTLVSHRSVNVNYYRSKSQRSV